MSNIKVSVICPTYNQQSYLGETIRSIVSQQTNFKFELIIGDDASSDATSKLVHKYIKKYPDKIIYIKRNKNIGSMKNLKELLILSKGKYISICEGDDYFTDINKLQTQYDYLQKNKDVSLCFHPVKIINQNNEFLDIYPRKNNRIKKNLVTLTNWNFIQTNSVMYRNLNTYKKIPTNINPGDWYVHLYHAKCGRIGFINKIMSVYRKHDKGIWWESENDFYRFLKKNYLTQFIFYLELQKLFKKNDLCLKNINDNLSIYIQKIIEYDTNNNTNFLYLLIKKYPKNINDYFLYENKNLLHKKQIKSIYEELEEFKKIRNSLFYKYWNIYTRIKKNINFI